MSGGVAELRESAWGEGPGRGALGLASRGRGAPAEARLGWGPRRVDTCPAAGGGQSRGEAGGLRCRRGVGEAPRARAGRESSGGGENSSGRAPRDKVRTGACPGTRHEVPETGV